MDKLTKEQRHRCMSAIKGKNTKPELVVRKFLFCRGFRYRLNHPWLPGHPDLVLRKYRTVIFVNGCFWHGHEGCKYYVLPKTNVEFWQNKIKRNTSRYVIYPCQEPPLRRHYEQRYRGTATANFDGVALYYHLGMSVETESPPTDFRGFRIHAIPYLS